MEKKIAKFLAFVMFLGVFQGMNFIQAAENTGLGFAVTKKMLKEAASGLVLADRDIAADETALVQWELNAAGEYELYYYIEAVVGTTTVTRKIKVEVNNADGTNLATQISVLDGDVPEQITYTERAFDNATSSWKEGTSKTSTVIEPNLKLGTKVDRTWQEYNVAVNNVSINTESQGRDNLRFRIKIVGNTLMLYTNGVLKGNITPFTLKVGGAEIGKKELFNGPKGYKIEPTHLYVTTGGDLASQTIIQDITAVKPGSKPGVKVSFETLKEVKATGIFDYIDPTNAQNITLNMATKYSATDNANSMRIDFKPQDGGSVKIDDGATLTNTVEVKNHVVALYLSKDEVTGSNIKVIQWDALKTSTVVDGSWQYGNQSDKYWPAYKGYTYLGYSLNKTSSNQVQLSITPYHIMSRATYNIYVLNNHDTEAAVPHMIYEYDPNKSQSQNITAVVPSSTANWFKIEVEIDGNKYLSQIVYYNPSHFPTTPPVTEIINMDNVYAVPSESNVQGAQPQAIGFEKLIWKAPSDLTELLKEGDLYYELLLRKDKEDLDPITNTNHVTDDKYATYSKIFKVSLNADNKPIVTVAEGTAGDTYNNTPELRYDPVNKTFTMEDVVLMNYGKDGKWEQIKLTENHLAATSGDYVSSITGKKQDTLSNRLVPGTYYLSFRTVLVSPIATKPIVYSDESNLISLSLDNTKEIIPIPTHITGVDTTTDIQKVLSYKINVGNVDVKSYVKRMLEPAFYYLHDGSVDKVGRFRGEYEVYLYQKADKLNQTISKVESGALTASPISVDNKLDLTSSWNGSTYIDTIREGGVAVFTVKVPSFTGVGIDSFELKGLDPNQVYYIQMRTKLDPWRGTPNDKVGARYSLLSKNFTFTTTTTPIPPTSEDKVPPTPEKIWIEEQPNNNSVILGWAPAVFEEDNTIQKTYYEFVRTDKQLTSEEQKKTVEALVAADNVRVGFRSNSPHESQPYMSTYTSKNSTWTKLEPEQSAAAFRLTDTTLKPNVIYYYYVRTVCMIKGQPIQSSWIMVPVTTAPVSPPIHLKVEFEKNYAHNPKEEIVVSFEAPIPEGANVPGEYAFDFAIQGEEDAAYEVNKYSMVPLTSLKNSSDVTVGYKHYVYKITGLKPNRRYNIKVRIVDKTQKIEGTEGYPTSLYCSPVSTRTEYDEDEQEKDDQFEEILDQFENEVEKLRRKPYWEVEKGYTYKYRKSYMEAELSSKREYELVTGEGSLSAVYYMPASLIVDNHLNTILTITLGKYKASIRPYTLVSQNEAVKEAIAQIDSNKIEDYYVMIEFAADTTINTLQGETPLTPELFIDMELVYSKEKDAYIEIEIMDDLNELIEEQKKALVQDLEKELYDNKTIDLDALQDLLDEKVKKVEKEHAKRVKKVMERYTTSQKSIHEIDKAILLASELEAFAVNGYHYTGSWQSIETYNTGSVFYIEASELGIYILTGQRSLIDTMPSLAPYQSFISQYTLTDLFTLNGYMIKTAATKEQVYGIAAKMLGAKRGADYAVYLKNKGIKGVNNIGNRQSVRQDEAIYIAMQVYEQLYNRPIHAIAIKNRQSIKNIGAFQTIYRNYVYAAVELRIVDNPNSQVLPSKQLMVEEVIRMFYKVQVR
ncbi:hypothetical protein CS063_13515 [Sporanaerobium hydrogeniformans]|uniref:Uncharacterized protein n=1 Tax=Sporanaerobium hydrogeniformans TaxID=3072179 RepID=A0AC61DA01_9FIRM|nr:hypothetical protein [Sporanaerobium hydrogeniformans]PHV69852.1 hypothetical protein CS063_13515 [Sporanaerobium hydrogeniformans]